MSDRNPAPILSVLPGCRPIGREALKNVLGGVLRDHVAVEGAQPRDEFAAGQAPHAVHHRLRGVLVYMIEEYTRHCGHADLLRECLDGRTGQ